MFSVRSSNASPHEPSGSGSLPPAADCSTQDRAHQRGFLTGLVLGAASMLTPGCAGPRALYFPEVPLHSVSASPECFECLQSLQAVEDRLTTIEDIRAETMAIYWPVVKMLPAIKSRYDTAVEHHRALCEKACEYKSLLGAPDADRDAIAEARQWAQQTTQDLDTILELITHVQATGGSWKRGWRAPPGYEYIRPINID